MKAIGAIVLIPVMFVFFVITVVGMGTSNTTCNESDFPGLSGLEDNPFADHIEHPEISHTDESGNKIVDSAAHVEIKQCGRVGGADGGAGGGYGPEVNEIDAGACASYPEYQCTWWACVRRHQLGLEVGSHWGNGGDWAGSARAAGFVVDHTPEVGAAISYFNHDAVYQGSRGYGHVAVVEEVTSDGGARISEYNGGIKDSYNNSRVIPSSWYTQADTWFIHRRAA